jgi:hypothetical protein
MLHQGATLYDSVSYNSSLSRKIESPVSRVYPWKTILKDNLNEIC